VHERVDRLGDLDLAVPERLSLLSREQRDQLVEVLLDVMGRSPEDLASLGHGQLRPGDERPGSRLHGGVNV
jgi:hypothetical protein